MLLAGKRIIVTGAGRGIGRACALKCAAEGARVALVGKGRENLEQTAARIKKENAAFLACACDIGTEAGAAEAFERATAAWGGVDGLVNCAAIFRKAAAVELALEDWNELLRVNLTGVFLACREAFRRMPSGGSIVNIASLSGVPGYEKFPGFTAYNVSKYGVLGLTEILAVEGAERGLRVNCLSPGAVDTDMLRQAAPQLAPAMQPEEVAEAAVFLLSERSSALNGANLILAGNRA
ncbi:MAG: SDR family NAD(P)-dependent oxidoreductase [candidate division FCPU426 bacterium]